MKYLVTGKEMKLLDDNTSMHFHVPSMVLMEQAAMKFVQELIAYFELESNEKTKILVVCGTGNNGADGKANTGNGASGFGAHSGGSGIVIIRNKR